MQQEEFLWVKIDIDSPTEDIIAVAGSRAELAKILGVKPKSISEDMSRAKREGLRCSYLKIENPKDDED